MKELKETKRQKEEEERDLAKKESGECSHLGEIRRRLLIVRLSYVVPPLNSDNSNLSPKLCEILKFLCTIRTPNHIGKCILPPHLDIY